MEVTLNLTENKVVVRDVVFPIFRRHDLDGCTIYMMVADQHTEWSITVPHNGECWEVEVERPSWFGDIEYLAGLGHHASNAAEFAEAHRKALEFLRSVPNPFTGG